MTAPADDVPASHGLSWRERWGLPTGRERGDARAWGRFAAGLVPFLVAQRLLVHLGLSELLAAAFALGWLMPGVYLSSRHNTMEMVDRVGRGDSGYS